MAVCVDRGQVRSVGFGVASQEEERLLYSPCTLLLIALCKEDEAPIPLRVCVCAHACLCMCMYAHDFSLTTLAHKSRCSSGLCPYCMIFKLMIPVQKLYMKDLLLLD